MPSGLLTTFRREDLKNASALRILDLRINNFLILQREVFAEAFQLRHLYLSSNQLATVEGFAFKGLINLQSLGLKNNHLKILKRNTFAGMGNEFNTLDVGNNLIETIEAGALNLRGLRYLNLAHNRLRSLADNIFAASPNLTVISLAANNLTHIGQSFQRCANLAELFLEQNQIQDIDLQALAGLTELVRLSMRESGFQLTEASPRKGSSVNSSNLIYLDISKNNLTDVDILSRLDYLTALKELLIEDNQLNSIMNLDEFLSLAPSDQDFDAPARRYPFTIYISGNNLTQWYKKNIQPDIYLNMHVNPSYYESFNALPTYGGIVVACDTDFYASQQETGP